MIGSCRVFCWMLALLLPMATVMADTNAAMLSASGAVKVNGAASQRATAVYAGDQVVTEGNGSATLTSRGTVIAVAERSAVVYGGSSLEMKAGRATVRTDSGMGARLGNLTITPASKTARYQLYGEGGRLVLAALEGSLNVTDGSNTTVLATGESLSHVDGQDQEPAPPPPASSKKHRALPGWALGVISAGVVGGVIGGVVATRGGESQEVSPSHP